MLRIGHRYRRETKVSKKTRQRMRTVSRQRKVREEAVQTEASSRYPPSPNRLQRLQQDEPPQPF